MGKGRGEEKSGKGNLLRSFFRLLFFVQIHSVRRFSTVSGAVEQVALQAVPEAPGLGQTGQKLPGGFKQLLMGRRGRVLAGAVVFQHDPVTLHRPGDAVLPAEIDFPPGGFADLPQRRQAAGEAQQNRRHALGGILH